MTETTDHNPALPLREALGLGLGFATVALLELGFVLSLSGPRLLAPGEFDLLLNARSLAGGHLLPQWAGAVHPDAPGTYLAALLLAPLQWLGMDGVLALKANALAHFGFLVFAATGLAGRLAGRSAAWITAGILLLAQPSLLAASQHFLGTTLEAAGTEIAVLWGFIELCQRKEAPPLAALATLGLVLGLLLSMTVHVALLLPVVFWLLLRRWGRDALGPSLVVIASAAVVFVPWRFGRDPTGPIQAGFSLKGRTPTELAGSVSWADVQSFVAHLPHALLDGTVPLPEGSPWAAMHQGWAVVLGLASVVALLRYRRGLWGRGLPAPLLALALAALCMAAPLPLAGDLLGYPAGYRYFINPLALAAVVFGIGAAEALEWLQTRSGPVAARGARAALVLCLGCGLATIPRIKPLELTPPEAAFFAAQHRLSFSQGPMHTHFLLLLRHVHDEEMIGWAQGYGLHLAREFLPHRERAAVEVRDREMMKGYRTPPAVDALAQVGLPRTWTEVAHVLPAGAVRAGFFAGIGLGLGEDGVLDGEEALLAEAVPATQRKALSIGVGAAMGERLYWSGGTSPVNLSDDSEGRWQALLRSSPFVEGVRRTAGKQDSSEYRALFPRALPPPPPGDASGVGLDEVPPFALGHPLTYARVGWEGRGDTGRTEGQP